MVDGQWSMADGGRMKPRPPAYIYVPYPYDPFFPGYGFGYSPYDYSFYPPYATSPYDPRSYDPYYNRDQPRSYTDENAPQAESGSGNVTLRVEPREVEVYV